MFRSARVNVILMLEELGWGVEEGGNAPAL